MPKLATRAAAGLAWGLAWGLTGLLVLGVPPALAESTLAMVKARGRLLCGINGQLPGFSVQDDRKEWVGFEIDYCRAVAAAVLGDGSKVGFVPLIPAKRFDALRDGSIDVLMRNTTASLERTAGTGVRDATVIYVDAQSVVVPKTLNVKELTELDGKTVCVLRGTPYLPRLQEWFAERRCAEPEWLEVVRWTHFDLLDAEEAIKQVGNYAETYERNIGKGSALKFARGVNALWSRGGVMYPLPMQ